jgi:DNA-binding transcriptional LysR family regulator
MKRISGSAWNPAWDRNRKKLHYEPVYSVDFLAIAPPEHALAKTKRFTLRDLSQHDLVVGSPGTHVRRTLEEAFHRQNLKPQVAVETDTSAFTIACVQAGMGVGVLAGVASGTLCQNLVVRSLQRQLGQRRIVVMWKRGRQLPQAMHELIQQVCHCRSVSPADAAGVNDP